MTTTTYTASATPTDDGLVELLVLKHVPAGIDGPFTNPVKVAADDVDDALLALGFVRTADFGPLCANGFQTAPAVPVR